MVTIHIKENNKQAKQLIEYLKTLDYVTVSKVANTETEKALKELSKGKGQKIKNVKTFLNGL